MKQISWPLLFSVFLLSGCTTTITNLTPSTEKRQTNGFYSFEVALDTRQNSIQKDTLRPFVLIGSQAYPMQRTPRLDDRWETLAPVPADKEFVSYQFKFNYDYSCIPRPKAGSKLSRPYQLQILDK